jgi:cell wall-associated NlpC family hydrolase
VKYTDPSGLADIEGAVINLNDFLASDGSLRSPEILDENTAAISESFIGGGYFWGGQQPTNEGGPGIDCSSNALISGERASSENIRDRTANEMYNDPNLLIDGQGQVGSLNFYDWDGDGIFDHVTVVGNDGMEIHPSSNAGTINSVAQGSLDSFAQTIVNKAFNWAYILGD